MIDMLRSLSVCRKRALEPAACIVLVALPLLASCGQNHTAVPDVEVPSWAKVAPEQITEAKKHGVPVAFENDLGMRFVLIPAGTFLMGSPEDEEGRHKAVSGTRPFQPPTPRPSREVQHRVTLTKPYYMQTTEVTNGQYRSCRSRHAVRDYRGHSLNGKEQPAVSIAWEDARHFAEWLTARDARREYRLPTEAEWERACRAGTRTKFWWGESGALGHQYANGLDVVTDREFTGMYGSGWQEDDGHRVAAPVGCFPANPYGLHDMLGNVCEYCAMWCGDYPQGPVTDPPGRVDDWVRVARGGAWMLGVRFLRSASRRCLQDFGGYIDHGFRLISPLPEPGER